MSQGRCGRMRPLWAGLCRPRSHSRSRCSPVRGLIGPREVSAPDPLGVARPAAKALVNVDDRASTDSGPRPPGSNRPVRMDRKTALTSTPSPIIGVSMFWPGRPAGGRSDWLSEAGLTLGSVQPGRGVAQLGDHRVQALTVDELHGIEADIPVLAHLEYGHDVGMVQSSRAGLRGGTARRSSGRHPPAAAGPRTPPGGPARSARPRIRPPCRPGRSRGRSGSRRSPGVDCRPGILDLPGRPAAIHRLAPP